MSSNVQGSMRGDGVPTAPGIVGLFQEMGLQDPQGVVNMENQWRHHGYHAFRGVDTQAASAAGVRGGLLIALRADVSAAEEVRDVVDIVPDKAMALDVVTAGGTFTVINVHGPGSGGDSWASKVSFLADMAMYAAAGSAGGTRPVLIGRDFNIWLESLHLHHESKRSTSLHHEAVRGTMGTLWVPEGGTHGRGGPAAYACRA